MRLSVGNLALLANAPDEEEIVKESKPKKERVSKVSQPILCSIDDACLDLNFENQELKTNEVIYIDTETTGLMYRNGDQPWMVSMCDDSLNSWCGIFPVHPYTREVIYDKFAQSRDIWKYIREIVENENILKGYFNGKFDIRNLANIGITHKGPYTEDLPQGFHEVSIMARLYHTDLQAYNLKYLAKYLCGLGDSELGDLKKLTQRLRKLAKKAGWKIYEIQEDDVESTNSNAKKEKVEPDYWLTMYAHLLLNDSEEISLCRELAEEYCRKDTLRTAKIAQKCLQQFEEIPSKKFFYAMEMKVHPIVMEMEDIGVMVNVDQAKKDREDCKKKATILLQEIREEVGDNEFNPESPAQLAEYLFTDKPEGLGLPPTETTKTGQFKTGNKDLQQFSNIPFLQKVWDYKAQNKAVTLFFDKYIANVKPYEPKDKYQATHFHIYFNDGNNDELGIIHPEINQGSVRTFRLSMSNPNLQQAANPETSARGANVVQVRSAFRPRPGYTWYLYDFSGQELRLLGGLMQIPEILDAVKNGRDIPTELGNKTWGGRNNLPGILQVIDSCEFEKTSPSSDEVAEFWKKIGWNKHSAKEYSRVTDLQIFADNVFKDYDYDIVRLEKALNKKTVRTRTKMCLYGKAYGAGVHGVVGLLRCSPNEAKKWLRELDEALPRMSKVGRQWTNEARQNGYIEDAYGRRLNVDPEFAYKAINYKIQATAGSMLKFAKLGCQKHFREVLNLGPEIVRIALTIHDELAFEIRNDYRFKWLLRDIKAIMEDPWHEQYVGIPMKVEVNKCVRRWDEESKVIL